MMNYEPLVLDPVSINISNNLELLTPPIPSGGPQFLYIMALLDMIAEDGRIKDNNQTQQHMVEVSDCMLILSDSVLLTSCFPVIQIFVCC